jgi:hypothetical protein
MAVWQMILYAAASFLALRSLVSLMSQHRKQHRQLFLARETERLEQASIDAKRARLRNNDAPGKAAGSAA